ncbi:hypothetical protein [Paraburkholderia sp. GAS42]|jgi:hypothetical protein|uniref:hypothetical protein n=1 Tax=Paraburkholderia sp. GAS42 TaxID=3035135 RepID=UPI003D24DF6A
MWKFITQSSTHTLALNFWALRAGYLPASRPLWVHRWHYGVDNHVADLDVVASGAEVTYDSPDKYESSLKLSIKSLSMLESAIFEETVEYGLTFYRAFRNYATAAVTDTIKQITGRDPISFNQFLKQI